MDKSGYTLLEIILALSIFSLIALTLYSVLTITVNSYRIGEIEDEIILNGKYLIEFIKNEVRSADKIISSAKIDSLDEKYENNFGFVVMNYAPNATYKYNYSTYYFKDNKIYRITANTNEERLPRAGGFSGHNEIAEYIISIEDSYADFNERIVKLSVILGENNRRSTEFNMTIFIRCPVLY
ncbi:PulJ/GspJ family protein [Tepidimicrobium xylanilyticum]|uniref:Prepilin-type N-terminal cleavage/methylation domain-containing protein n=1 Tax=Tepidimicrobium xylanilyticum TaxID=1123352 RepID=A0A1H3CPE3_9FIRM|nr:prepilin-type N-terminal cleavage/methylation domain-containing protein [Tepidimicrobium xylanilyticum]GMG97701.1 hypothetical protein EN5CB1_25270 [Tepidimicrobium xylanilyticum]SDX55975.1 prepilin-type N-terminal cleavage/methylation domain-containing protein [Tepidimicrobium xylanilyticum]